MQPMTMRQINVTLPAADALDGYLFVLPWEPVNSSGVNQVVLNLLREFEMSGDMRAHLLIQSWERATPETTLVGTQCYIRFRVRSADSAGGTLRGLIAYCLRLPGELWQLGRILWANRVAAINVHYPGLSCASFSLLKFIGVFRGRLILTFHGLDLKLAAESRGWRRALWNWSGRHADTITACSGALARDVVDAFPAWRSRVRPIHNGLDVERFTRLGMPELATDPELAGKQYILNVGTFEVKKGHEVLVRAFAAISSLFPDLHLALVGGAGPTRAGLETLVAELGLTNRVVFRENVDHAQIAGYYRNAAVFVLPSRSEPFGIAILEAGAFGIPVVACRVGGVPEIIDDPGCGMLIEPDDATGLGVALSSLLTDPVLAKAMGARLRKRVETRFTWGAAYREYLECVRKS